MFDNQLAAQILFSNQLATQEQIMACWPLITLEKDIGALLVENGILSPKTYQDLSAYLDSRVAAGSNPGMPSAEESQPTSSAGEAENTETWTAAAARADAGTRADSGARMENLEAVKAPDKPGPTSSLQELFAFARQHEVADLHLSAGNPMLVRRFGSLQPLDDKPIQQATMQAWVESVLDARQTETFRATGDMEIIYAQPGWGRFRVTVIKQRQGWALTARLIPDRIRSFEDIGLPEACRELTQWAQGLVLVTGPVGSGKSSTLNTLVDMVNRDRHDHIITLEEPIEFIYQPAGCRITQRQIKSHTASQEAALRAALREDPDIIVISELRDLETIRLAVSAAETGHLVFGTMNTANASRTIYRLIDSFPPEEQGIIRNMISESLRGVISQQLLPRKDGQGMVTAFEVLLINSAVANMIRKDEAHQLGTAMITGKSSGMALLDDSLRALVEKGVVEPQEAWARATNPKDFEKYLGRGAQGAAGNMGR